MACHPKRGKDQGLILMPKLDYRRLPPDRANPCMSQNPAPAAGTVTLGTPLSPYAFRVLLLGSGELGKEVAIELQRFGVEVIAADRYADAPAMQVAHRSHVLDMLDGAAIQALVAAEQPDLIVPEIEAIATATLVELERGFAASGSTARVIPTARAAQLTM